MRVRSTTVQNAFGKYLKKAMEGEEIIVTKNENGVAKLTAYQDPVRYVIKEDSAGYYVNRRVTYEEFLQITENSDARYELIDGEIYLMASPTHRHQVAVTEILVQLYQYFSDKQCSPLTAPFDVRLSNNSPAFEDDPNVVQPDVLVICDEDKIDEDGRYHGVPSLVIEVLSPSTRSKDMIKKLSLYALSGVSEYYIVDLENEQILKYVMENKEVLRFEFVKMGECIQSSCFDGLNIETNKI